MEGIQAYEITPRHLFFNVLKYSHGEISREKLMGALYKASFQLVKRGYKIQLGFKYTLKKGKSSEEIDSELNHWLASGMLKCRNNVYVFNPRRAPMSDLDDITNLVNEGLSGRVKKDLVKAVEASL
ncbi:MAG: hypothetical protein ACFFDN_29025 [Candidatus Hodarchaeota archaeon]